MIGVDNYWRTMSTQKARTSLLLRLGLPLLVIVAWLGLGGVGGPYFGKIDEVSSNDLATFLPSSAESTSVNKELEKFRVSGTIPAIVVFESKSEMGDAEKTNIARAVDAMKATGEVKGEVSPAIASEDNKAQIVVVPIDSNAEFDKVVPKLQQSVADAKVGIDYKFTGPAMFSRDLNKAFAGIDGTLLFVALGVVFVILLIVYRSPVLPIVTLMGAMLALATAILIVWHLAKAGVTQLNGQVQGILFILVIGAATDYALLYISRYREELTHWETKWQATKSAWKASWEPIVAAGGTVTLGLLCLLASDLGSNKALGPVGGIGVVLAILSALTFLPAVLLLLGRAAFWPKMPHHVPGKKQTDYHENHPTWSRVGEFVGKYPRQIWVTIMVVLVVAAAFLPQLRAEGVSQQDLIIGPSEAREGQAMLNRHFPSGSGSPVYIVTPADARDDVIAKLEAEKGVDDVSVMTTDKDMTTMPVGRERLRIEQKIRDEIATKRDEQLAEVRKNIETQMAGAPQAIIDQVYEQAATNVPPVDTIFAEANPFNDIVQKEVDGEIVLEVTLNDPASSVAARETVGRLRESIQSSHPATKFGGVSAIQLDTNNAANHDLRIIIPLILAAITIVLMLLLRSIVAPLVLLATTVLSFAATLGIAALLFNHVWKFPGADPSVIIFGFVFLVALGIDYNIFLMTRVREETGKIGLRAGTLKALSVTGGVITSAGIVLASTFAALYVIPILFLAQIAFIVAFGVLLDTLIVRSLLVPALTIEIGRPMWWPSKLSRKK